MRISDWSSDVCSSDLIACRAIEVQAVASADIKVIGHSQIDTIDRLARSVLQIVGDNGRERHRPNIASSIVIDNRKRRGGGHALITRRSDERSVGKECDSMCSIRWSQTNSKKNKK